MNTKHITLLCSLGALLVSPGVSAQTSQQLLNAIDNVNRQWQSSHPAKVWAFWDHAAYYTGNMEVYRLTGKPEYYDYSDQWCRHNDWQGARETDKRKWRYSTYGEGQEYVLFGDWQICFQTYIDMYQLVPGRHKVARAIEVMSHEVSMDERKFWWWSDALYMVMPVMTKMYRLTGERKYLDKLTENFLWSDSLMWDSEAQLYYRDAKYIWPKVTTICDGGKSFWARGDGWVLAGLAKVLADMPRDYEHRDVFVKRFQQLAAGVKACQQEEGYWSRSMLCEADAPGPETSGTAFFTYGLLWGVNHGLLSRDEYSSTIEKAWEYLYTKALQSDNTIGYVQPIGEKPDPTRVVNAQSQAPFGTGAWLLAACERVRYLDNTASQNTLEGAPKVAVNARSMTVTISNPSSTERRDVVELDAEKVFEKLNIAGGRQFIVLDGDNVEQPYQLTSDGKVLVQAFVGPTASTTLTLTTGEPRVARLDVNGRIYPNREDDLSWETDKNAWRMYGPKMHGKGVTGFDTFAKNVTYPILDALYQSELTSYGINGQLQKQGRGNEWAQIHRDVYTYHRNRGEGMDAYTVGKTLGAGAPTIMNGTEMSLPDVYETAQITENGPLRFSVIEQMFEHDGIKETRTISQDKGQHMAQVTVDYDGVADGTMVASGIVVHKSQPTAYVINRKTGYVAVADALDTPQGQNGQLYIACLFPEKMKTLRYIPLEQETAGGVGHVVGETAYRQGQPFTYYAGTAWSKYDVTSMSVWESILTDFSIKLKQPLKVEY